MFKKRHSRKELEKKIEKLEYENKDLKITNDSCETISRNALSELDSTRKQINRLMTENKNLKERNEELEKENAVFRQYYSLDEEPSQETKDKMYLDQKYREMDREIIRLQALTQRPNIVYSPVYTPYGPYFYPWGEPRVNSLLSVTDGSCRIL